MPKPIISILILVFSVQNLHAQNYFYVHSHATPEEKDKMLHHLRVLSEQFDMEDVTFAIIVSKLPKKIEATTEYSFNSVVDRRMMLFRINTNLPHHKTFEVLAHEMVHAYQYYTKELVRYDRTTFSHKGVKYKNVSAIPHSKRPWEIEAIQYGQHLVEELGRKQNAKIESPRRNRSELN